MIAGDSVREVSLKEYRYAGKERDDATGLDYYGHRYYAPWMGRWLSPDPIGPEDDLNLYQFVRGDPVGSFDLTGLFTETRSRPDDIGYEHRVPATASLDRAQQGEVAPTTTGIRSTRASSSPQDLTPSTSVSGSTSRVEPTVPIGSNDEIRGANASPTQGSRLDPWDNTTGLPIDPDNPDSYLLPEEVIEIEGSRPSAEVIASTMSRGVLDAEGLARINDFIDVDHNKHITWDELRPGIESIVYTKRQYAMGMRTAEWSDEQPYTYDAQVSKFIDDNYTAGSPLEVNKRVALSDETAVQRYTDGYEWTRAANRGAVLREMNAPRNPQRVVTMVTFGAMVLAPEVVAAWNAAIRITEAITGRRSGVGGDDLLRGKTTKIAGATMTDADRVGSLIEGLVEGGSAVAGGLTANAADDAAKAAKAVEDTTEGTATIHYYKNPDGSPHWSVETSVPKQPTLHTHKVAVRRGGTRVEVFDAESAKALGKPIGSHTERLPKPDSARSVQEHALEAGDTGPFAQKGRSANSCATFVCDVVSGGGGKFPYKPEEAANFLRRLFKLPPI